MLEAAWWGFVGGAALLLGAAAGLWLPVSTRVIGGVMAVGTGVLVSALTFELTEEAYQRGGGVSAVLGLLAGSIVFFAGDWWIDRRGGSRRKSPTGQHQAGAGGTALALGALLDGIPESAAIGVSLLGGGSVGLPVVVAVFLSNIPESMSSSAGMRKAGHSTRFVLGMWLAVAVASAVAAALGYALLGDASGAVVGFIQTFAAGAILTMLADTMVPEAVEHAGSLVGLLVVAGFVVAFLLSFAG